MSGEHDDGDAHTDARKTVDLIKTIVEGMIQCTFAQRDDADEPDDRAQREAEEQLVALLSHRAPSPQLRELLVMQRAMLLLDTLSSPAVARLAEKLRDEMDPLWYALTQSERDAINGMPIADGKK